MSQLPTVVTPPIVTALCANCSGGAGFEACRHDRCSCCCHLIAAEMEMCEFETEPFTDAERGRIAAYNCRIAGIPDCFDVHTIETIPDEWTMPDVIAMFRSYYGLLKDWRSALFDLTEDLAQRTEPYDYEHGSGFVVRPMSTAARRYLQMEAAEYIGARDAHRTLVIEYFLGHDEYGDKFDYISEANETLADWRNSLAEQP